MRQWLAGVVGYDATEVPDSPVVVGCLQPEFTSIYTESHLGRSSPNMCNRCYEGILGRLRCCFHSLSRNAKSLTTRSSTCIIQVDYRWNRVRKMAGLNHVRFKDLRSQVAIYGERAGVPLTVLKAAMGHGDETMTQRYQQHRASRSAAQMQAIEQEMFSGLRGAEVENLAYN